MIVQALKDIYDNNEKVSFEAATYFVGGDHKIICENIELDPIKIRERVIEALRLGGVKKKRMISDIIEAIQKDFKMHDVSSN
jgi:hypothetical protein